MPDCYCNPLVQVKISDSAVEVLNDVRKAKPRIQKAPKPLKPFTPASAKSKGVNHFFSSFEMPKWRSSSEKRKSKEEEMEMNRLLEGEEVQLVPGNSFIYENIWNITCDCIRRMPFDCHLK